MLFLLVGAAGVGKSHMLKAVLRVMHDEDLGGAVFSAYTGVAVTQLPAPSATCCTLLGISGDAFAITSELQPPTPQQSLLFESIVGDISKLSLLVLDEASFLSIEATIDYT